MISVSEQEIMRYVEKHFKNGHHLVQLPRSTGGTEKVKLPFEKELLPYTDQRVHLLSPSLHLDRDLCFRIVDELIRLFPAVKEEGVLDSSLCAVIETLLLGLDYLTDEQFHKEPFTDEHRKRLSEILSECFSERKTHSFCQSTQRPSMNVSILFQEEEDLYCLDQREERTRIYMAVLFRKTDNIMGFFRNVGYLLNHVHMKPNTDNIEYEEALKGLTNHELHIDHLFYFNTIKNALSWILNSYSWSQNKLMVFDQIDIRCKLGIQEQENE